MYTLLYMTNLSSSNYEIVKCFVSPSCVNVKTYPKLFNKEGLHFSFNLSFMDLELKLGLAWLPWSIDFAVIFADLRIFRFQIFYVKWLAIV